MQMSRLAAAGLAVIVAVSCASCSKHSSSSSASNGGRDTRLLIVHDGDLVLRDLSANTTFAATTDTTLIEDYASQFSYDGLHIVWQRLYHDGSGHHVWTMDGEGGTPHELLGPEADLGPCGALTETNHLGFTRPVGARDLIEFCDLTGDTLGSATPSGQHVLDLQFNARGGWLAYIAGNLTGVPATDTTAIYLADADGTHETQIATPSADTPEFIRWSPSGTSLLVVRDVGGSTGPRKLYVINTATHAQTYLADIATITTPHEPLYATWSMDETRIYYTAVADGHLYSIPPAGGAPTDISLAPAGFPCTSSGGGKLAYTQGTSVIVCNPDGTTKQVAYTAPDAHAPVVESFY